MKSTLNIFLNKKILVYGLGKSGLATFNFLKKKSKVFTYDDNKKSLISYQDLKKIKFDYIIISPGIDIKKCKLSKFLKTYSKKIYTDLDVFFSFFKNDCITVTGTNGKSTTCQLLYEILLKQKFDVRLVGNIGNPILSLSRIKPKTIFIVEASSYQLEYSKIFKSKFAVLLNITPDHIERHRTIKRYVSAKFKLIKNQSKQCLCFLKKGDFLIEKELKVTKIKSKIIKVDTLKYNKILFYLKNEYFLTEANKENLTFVLAIADKLKLDKKILFNTIQNFKGLRYRQQIVYKKSNLIIINDSKSTSFSSSIGVLKTNSNIYWLLGGINKKGDKFNLPKKYHHNIKAFIFGKKRNFFNNQLKGKIQTENFYNLRDAFKKVVNLVNRQRFIKKTILFSPSAASFDSFKNFEDRGQYFNNLIKKYLNE